jgi:hypothetical protein
MFTKDGRPVCGGVLNILNHRIGVLLEKGYLSLEDPKII